MARTTRASDAGQIEKRNFKGEKRRKSGERCGQVSREIDWPTKISNSIERRNYVHVRFLHNRVVKPRDRENCGRKVSSFKILSETWNRRTLSRFFALTITSFER